MDALPLTICIVILFIFLQLNNHQAFSLHCQTSCGDIQVPYPFGIGHGCYLDPTFQILCDHSTGSATLAWLAWDVDNISLSDHTFRHKNFTGVTLRFDGASKAYVDHAQSSFLGGRPYILSHEQNTFVAMGCDFFVRLVDEETGYVQGSCSSLCNVNETTTATTPLQQRPTLSDCSGLNCCQFRFPADLRNWSVRVETINSWTSDPDPDNQCCFFSSVDNELLRTNSFKVMGPSCNETYHVPTIHKWAVGNSNCSVAKGRKDYLCGEHTECIDYTTGNGLYRCHCSNGFRGNPYLPQGCQDIDECADRRDNNCPTENRCINTAGSYFCVPSRNRILVLFLPLGIGLAVGIVGIAIIALLGWRKLKEIKARKAKQTFFKRNGGLLLQQQISSSTKLTEITIFSIDELDKATDRFSNSRVLGRGGLGIVYKGMLSNGIIVAVKKANMVVNNSLQIPQFINEVFILSQISHRHIVKLLGCCLEAEVPLLVYEYVPNGTLSDHLHHEYDHPPLPWEQRLRIAAEVAGALAYLHSYATTAIFHRDIKSNNILLDQNYKAVLSDFGLSKSVSVDRTHLTTMVRGTFGYLDPQYFLSGRLNDKSDVYGFGVVVAEILTGQRAVADDDEGLAFRFRLAVKQKRVFEMVEEVVALEGEAEEILAVATLAKRCLKLKSDMRPSMKEVSAGFEEIIRNLAARRNFS